MEHDDMPRVSFPGVVSGVDYDAVIEAYDTLFRRLMAAQVEIHADGADGAGDRNVMTVIQLKQ